MSELEARLQAARARIAQLEKAAEDKRAESATLEQVEALEMRARDEEEIQKAEAVHGSRGHKIAVVHTEMGVIIVKRPNHLHWKRFQDTGEIKLEDAAKLVRSCLVHPDKARLEEIFETLPATPAVVASEIVDLARGKTQEVAGK